MRCDYAEIQPPVMALYNTV